jgi:hypothetical protein
MPKGSLVSDIPAGDGKLVYLFLRCALMESLLDLDPKGDYLRKEAENVTRRSWSVLRSIYFAKYFTRHFHRSTLLEQYTYARYSTTLANGGPFAHGCYVRSDFAQPFKTYEFHIKQPGVRNICKELRHLGNKQMWPLAENVISKFKTALVGWWVANRQIKKLHRKESFSIFPSPAGMSLTKLSLGGNNVYMTSLFPPRESLVSDIPAGDRYDMLFLRCLVSCIAHVYG